MKKGIIFLPLVVFLLVMLVTASAYAQVFNPANGHYYELVTLVDISMTWSEARDAAAAMTFNGMPGHLATVTSASEDSFIVSTWPGIGSSTRVWIGGTDAAIEGNWQWITSESWSYTNWGGGEPSGDGNCLEYWDNSQWNDEPCSNPKTLYLGGI